MPATKKVPDTPELDKLRDLGGRQDTIGAFLDWLGMNGMAICHYPDEHSSRMVPVHKSRADIIAEHFGIDQRKMESERQALLDWASS